MNELALYDSARNALAEARKVDEVLHVRDDAERMRLYARQAKDRGLMADAMEIQLRAERKLGEMLVAARAAGQIGTGRPKIAAAGTSQSVPKETDAAQQNNSPAENGSDPEPFPERVTLRDAGIDKKLSMKAQQLAAVPQAAFETVLDRAREKIVSGGAVVVNPIKDLTTAEKKARRAGREAELGARQQALPNKRFGVILADPEWRFETWGEGGLDRAADNHYPTSPLEAIKARDVTSIATDDCVLLLWATVPMLPEALEVVAAWGFAYKSHFVWLKNVASTGYWNRNQHELLLVATRGEVPAPAMGTQLRSALAHPVGAHSEKPPFAHEIAEAYFPSLPKIELNARARRDGWDAWGLEVPEADTAPAGAMATPPAGDQKSEDSINDRIRAGYAANEAVAAIAAATGLSANAVEKRAARMRISDPQRQRRAVAEANRRRGKGGADA